MATPTYLTPPEHNYNSASGRKRRLSEAATYKEIEDQKPEVIEARSFDDQEEPQA